MARPRYRRSGAACRRHAHRPARGHRSPHRRSKESDHPPSRPRVGGSRSQRLPPRRGDEHRDATRLRPQTSTGGSAATRAPCRTSTNYRRCWSTCPSRAVSRSTHEAGPLVLVCASISCSLSPILLPPIPTLEAALARPTAAVLVGALHGCRGNLAAARMGIAACRDLPERTRDSYNATILAALPEG